MAPKRLKGLEVQSPASEEEDESSSTEEEDEEGPETQSTPLFQMSSHSENLNAKKPRFNKPFASSSKRPGESELAAKEAKRPKKKVGEEGMATAPVVEEVKKTGESVKKLLFQRLFSEDDEIALLKGMLHYSAKKGDDPCADMNGFYAFVKKSFHTDISKAQVMNKVRRFKKRFENNAKKGEDRTFLTVHEQDVFELLKRIWGQDGICWKPESSTAPYKKVDDAMVPKGLDSLLDMRFGISEMGMDVIKLRLGMAAGEGKAALVAKWRKLQLEQLELFAEQSKLALEHFKSEAK